MNKLIPLCLIFIFCFSSAAVSQSITNSGPDVTCAIASGTLTVNGYTQVQQWEAGYFSNGVFIADLIFPVTTNKYWYSTTVTYSYRAKLSRTKYSEVKTITVLPPSVGGTVSGDTNYHKTGTGSLQLSGHLGNVIKWQQSVNGGGTWSDIAFTGTTLTYSNVTQTTNFRALVQRGNCPSSYSSIATISIYTTGTLSGNATMEDGGLATMTIENNDGKIVQWEYSTDGGTTWTQVANALKTYKHVIERTTKFRASIQIVPGRFYTNTHEVTWLPYTQANPVSNFLGKNYVKVSDVIAPNITDTAQVTGLTSSQKRLVSSFMDGRGRTLQNILHKGSPQEKDVVTFSTYEFTNGVLTEYLPYISTADHGCYRSNPVAEQAAFYANGTGDKIADTPYPFSKTIVENSPLSRVLEKGSVGQDWQPGRGHTLLATQLTNVANEVRKFNSDGTSTSFYLPNELIKSEVTDPDQRKQQTFTDKEGKTILTRTELNEVIGQSSVLWLETYYIYYPSSQLRYIISPKGVTKLQSEGWSFSAALEDQYVHEFVYDNLGRLIEKKVPGQVWIYYCYDRLDRVVLVQDGNIRAQKKWFYLKYDRAGRMIMQGLYTNTTHTNRQAIQQNVVDPLYTNAANKHYEERGTASHGYTNQTFPTDNTEVLTVNYFSSYDFDFNGAADFSYVSQNLPGETTAGSAVNLPTGSKRLVVGSAVWLFNYIFYDNEARAIQTRSNNHLSVAIDNLVTLVYDFEGKIKIKKQYHNAGSGRVTTVINKYNYDNQGRLLQVHQNNNAAPADQLVAQYEYNGLGQLVDKKLHNTSGTAFLQSIDFRYDIHGWLASINNAQLSNDGVKNDETSDYFGIEMLYEKQAPGLSNTPSFNGNISALTWKSTGSTIGATDQRSYKFSYDKANRLKSAVSQMSTATAWTKEADAYNESTTYDQNGNILTLRRNQRNHQVVSGIPSYTHLLVDNLQYIYSATSGNQLDIVNDLTGNAQGYKGSVSATPPSFHFSYDLTGNLTVDKNKGIDSLHYNYQGKVRRIKFSDGRVIIYSYDANGTKIKVRNYVNGTLNLTTDYLGGFVYQNGVLDFFASHEGRVVKKGNTLEYQYSIADHQGNTRVVFTSVTPPATSPVATFEGNTNDGASQYKNINAANIVSFVAANHTTGGTKVVRMNQSYKIGPTKSLKVYPGDKVDIEVWEYHEGQNGFSTNSTPLTTMITSVALAFGGASGGIGESGAIYNGVNTALTTFSLGANQGDSRPAAYLNYILFDKDYKVLDAGWQLAPATRFTKQKLSFNPINIKEAGFIFVYLSYDNASNNWVYFDDLKVSHTKTNVLQYNEYYPFGLQTNNSWTRETDRNNYLYNSASELNPTTTWYDLFYRNYDPALARFAQIDPEAQSFGSLSPYHYSGNNPIMFNDPNGDRYCYLHQPRYASSYKRIMSYATGGGRGSIMPGSGNHWLDQLSFPEGGGGFMMTIDFNALEDGAHVFNFANGQPSNYTHYSDANIASIGMSVFSSIVGVNYNPNSDYTGGPILWGDADGTIFTDNPNSTVTEISGRRSPIHDEPSSWIPISGDVERASYWADQGDWTRVGLYSISAVTDLLGLSALGKSTVKAGARAFITQGGKHIVKKAAKNPMMTPRETAAALRNPKLNPMMQGKGIDRSFRDMADRNLILGPAQRLGILQINPTNRGADMVGKGLLNGTWWDVTTQASWQSHVSKYGTGGIGLFY